MPYCFQVCIKIEYIENIFLLFKRAILSEFRYVTSVATKWKTTISVGRHRLRLDQQALLDLISRNIYIALCLWKCLSATAPCAQSAFPTPMCLHSRALF